MKCINKLKGLLCCISIAAVFMTGCGNSSNFVNPYSVYSNNYTLSNGSSNFFAEGYCITDDVNYGADLISKSVVADAAGAFNLTTQEVVYSKNIFKKLYPASTTKVLTAYIILRYGKLDDVVTVSYEASHQPIDSTKAGIREGDEITVRELLYGLMLESGNDCAVALAEYYAGSEAAFADVMNEEAQRIGCTGSHFVNPHGLSDSEHYTTIYDMYLILQQAITMREFTDIASSYEHTAHYTNSQGDEVEKHWNNTCRYMTGEADPPSGYTILAAKTGTTNAAGNCLVLYTENPDSEHIISIVYKADTKPNLYRLMSEILTGFAN